MDLTSDYRKRPAITGSGDLMLHTEKIHRLRRMARELRREVDRTERIDPVVRDDCLMRADRWDREANEMALEAQS
jgi:hypothetical protein